ncbi:MAG: hypothetical protein KatS3mg064_1793 [Tepidiforma sp.]|nr:NDP-sugar synthase [Tepidiforma sp.]GIW18636.1 MAG: hypothetical protein KatS3mg064_1793 [Tepidiforma sp.]
MASSPASSKSRPPARPRPASSTPAHGSSNAASSTKFPPGAVRVEETLFPSLVARRRVVLGYRFEGHWADLGTPARYLALHHALLEAGNAVHPAAAVHPTAVLERAAVGEGSAVGPRASLRGSVLWERVDVGEAAELVDTIAADGARIGPGARLRGCVIGPGATIGPGAAPPPGTIVDADGQYHEAHAG